MVKIQGQALDNLATNLIEDDDNFHLESGQTAETPAKEFFKTEENADKLAAELAQDLGFGNDPEMIEDITTLVKLHAKHISGDVAIKDFITDVIETLQGIAKDENLTEDELDTGIIQEAKEVSKSSGTQKDDALLRSFLTDELKDIAGENKKLEEKDAEKIAKLLGVTEEEAKKYIEHNKGVVNDVVDDIVADVFVSDAQ
jgi:hypothetical protein